MTSQPDAFERFVQAAKHYCALIETPTASEYRESFIAAIRAALEQLLASGFALPDVEPTTEAELPDGPTHKQWSSAFAETQTALGDLPGGLEAYLAVPDDLADVWRDVRRGLDALTSGSQWEDVSWEWKFGLQTHWGRHAEHALVALHDA